MTDSRIITGDCLEILPTLPHAQMIFADPPDNIGLKYKNHVSDSQAPEFYRHWLQRVMWSCFHASDVMWLSINKIWESAMNERITCLPHDIRRFVWYFTFGQHRASDCGNNYRPLFRVAPQDFRWNTDAIRIPSKRQKMSDKRADPRGRVPGDVWGGPEDVPGFCRIQGNNKERRKWHPTQHPEALVERCVLMSTKPGDLIIDPFLGTGTTMRVCQRLDRECIGIDISPEYCRAVAEETGVEIDNG